MKSWFLLNIFNRPAGCASKLFWAINTKIFSKTIKQILRFKKFYGEAETTVKTLIWIVPIVYLLYLKLRQRSKNAAKKFTHFIWKLSSCLFIKEIYSNGVQESPPQKFLQPQNYNRVLVMELSWTVVSCLIIVESLFTKLFAYSCYCFFRCKKDKILGCFFCS